VVGRWKSAAKIKVDVAAGTGTEDLRSKDLETEDRLPKRSSHRARGVHGIGCEDPGGHVLIVRIAAIAEQVEEDDSRKAHSIFRSTLQLRLVLLIDLAGEQLLVFLKMLCPLLQLGGARSRAFRQLASVRRARSGRGIALGALCLQLLAELRDLGTTGGRLLLKLQHHVLQFPHLGLQVAESRVQAGVGGCRLRILPSLRGARKSRGQRETYKKRRAGYLGVSEFHVAPPATI